MPARSDALRLPDRLRGYFWEYDADRLWWHENRHTILRKLLEDGGWDAVRWLRANVSDDELREFIVRRRGRGISPRRLRFWALILDMARPQVDAWIAAQRANPWGQRRVG